MNPEDLASQSVRLKEEQLRREEEKLREIEVKVQREINEKRQELLARESQLKEIEARMQREQSAHMEQMEANGRDQAATAAAANGNGEAEAWADIDKMVFKAGWSVGRWYTFGSVYRKGFVVFGDVSQMCFLWGISNSTFWLLKALSIFFLSTF